MDIKIHMCIYVHIHPAPCSSAPLHAHSWAFTCHLHGGPAVSSKGATNEADQLGTGNLDPKQPSICDKPGIIQNMELYLRIAFGFFLQK